MLFKNSYITFQLLHLLLGFRMKWFDHRIIVKVNETEKYALLSRDQRDKIWFPDPFLIGATDINVPRLSLDPLLLRVYKTRMLEFSILEEIQVVCPMNFLQYPVSRRAKKSSRSIKFNAAIIIL